MKKKGQILNLDSNPKNGEQEKFPGYPHYPAEEDIYRKFKEEKDLDPEDPSRKKDIVESGTFGKMNEKGLEDGLLDSDLDIPGSELGDNQEGSGGEDEENNYYSLGGENHKDLEEDNT